MAHVGTLRDFRFEDQADDIRGAALYGRDNEKLGKIDDVIFDHSSGQLKYAVVDTGGWLRSKRFLVTADRIQSRGDRDDEYVADLSKNQIEAFPAYDENELNDENRWGDYERDYRKASGFEETGGVLHQAGGTNILVPDSLPAEGDAAISRSGQPVSGYKSPIQHRDPSVMNTTPTGWGQRPENDRLTFVPDAIGADRGDIKDMQTRSSQSEGTTGARDANVSRREASDAIRGSGVREIVNREDDRLQREDSGKTGTVEQTIEGDAIFNSEDLQGRSHESGNVHDADVPSYSTLVGTGTATTEGRLPTYPDAPQGQRWARFEENLRRQRPKIVSHCSVCEELQNRHKEDAA
jgi:sporulation protein YlmC with PRC-barrel domain